MNSMMAGLKSIATGLAVALGLLAPTAHAQTYPSKPVKILVAYTAGGAADVLARAIAAQLTERLGQPFVVENLAGAGGMIGTRACAQARPDGYTLCMGSPSNILLVPLLNKEPRYSSDSFAPVTMVATMPTVLVVNAKSGIRNVDQLMQYIKTHPGTGWGTSGAGSTLHLTAVYINKEYGTSIEHVAYKGGVLAVQDVLAGHLPMAFDQVSSSLAFIRSGELIPILQQGSVRASMLPDVPTFSEKLLPKLKQDSFQGLFAPAGTPPAITSQLAQAIHAAVTTQPALREQLDKLGMMPIANAPAEFAAQINEAKPFYADLVKAAGIQPQ